MELELRTADNQSITSEEEFQEILEKVLDRWSVQELMQYIQEKDSEPEFSKNECVSYLAENFDFSDEIDPYCDLVVKAIELVDSMKSKRSQKLLDILEKLQSELQNVSIIG